MLRSSFGPLQTRVAAIGQGTFLMEHDEPKAVVAALRNGLDLGLTHIDTAELYGGGRVEELIGEALSGRRHEAFLVSKVLPQNATTTGTLRACERSLRRLRTDHLDAYLLHWPGNHTLSGTLEAFVRLKEQGKIRSFGVSNFGKAELEQATAIAGPGAIATNQILYHLGERSMEHDVLPYCEANGIAVVGYTPFGRRAFPPSHGAHVLQATALAYGATERQIALAFLTRRPSLFAIPKATHTEHLADNAGAQRLELDGETITALEGAFPVGPRRATVARI